MHGMAVGRLLPTTDARSCMPAQPRSKPSPPPPTHLLANCIISFWASALQSDVLPVPGGPCSSTNLQAERPGATRLRICLQGTQPSPHGQVRRHATRPNSPRRPCCRVRLLHPAWGAVRQPAGAMSQGPPRAGQLEGRAHRFQDTRLLSTPRLENSNALDAYFSSWRLMPMS